MNKSQFEHRFFKLSLYNQSENDEREIESMKKRCKMNILMLAMILAGGSLVGCGNNAAGESGNRTDSVDETAIVLADGIITVDGSEAGTEEGKVYLSNDIIYYEDRETYESGNPYGEGGKEERHSAEDAAAHTVVNITEAGKYRISGLLSKGQIRVDLGEEAATDPEAVVTLILDDVQIQCDVAPAILFMNVYECDNGWTAETADANVDTSAAGANLIIADGSTNNVTGSHVARIFKDNTEEKKLWKQDGAVYSYMSMNVDGEEAGDGILNITADNEGLDTELHLTINGGNLNIRSGNDGINTNEDGVSVTTINGGNIHIIAGLGEEGDGIDSNGWLVINGGTVIASANPAADAGLDSDMGSYVNGGIVVALGSTMDWAESDSEQVTLNLQFAAYRESDSAIVVKNEKDEIIFAYDPSMDEVVGENIRKYMGAIISSPAFTLEESYTVYIGGEVKGTEIAGVYETDSIAGYEGGIQQSYTGTDVMMRPGGIGGMFSRPDGGWQEGERPEKPEGFEGERPEMPESFEGERPEMPEGGREERPSGEIPTGERPEGGKFDGMMPGGMGGDGEANTIFFMQDKVNCFSGVTDIQEKL